MFWTLPYTDVYQLMSFERLHVNHGGLFSDHLLEEFLEILDALARELRERFETQ